MRGVSNKHCLLTFFISCWGDFCRLLITNLDSDDLDLDPKCLTLRWCYNLFLSKNALKMLSRPRNIRVVWVDTLETFCLTCLLKRQFFFNYRILS